MPAAFPFNQTGIPDNADAGGRLKCAGKREGGRASVERCAISVRRWCRAPSATWAATLALTPCQTAVAEEKELVRWNGAKAICPTHDTRLDTQ